MRQKILWILKDCGFWAAGCLLRWYVKGRILLKSVLCGLFQSLSSTNPYFSPLEFPVFLYTDPFCSQSLCSLVTDVRIFRNWRKTPKEIMFKTVMVKFGSSWLATVCFYTCRRGRKESERERVSSAEARDEMWRGEKSSDGENDLFCSNSTRLLTFTTVHRYWE